MPLAAAMTRHLLGSPYSWNAIICSESPATTVCTLRAASAPEVGFCPGVEPAISSIATVQVARTGMPLGVNSVYLAVTELTKAGKPVSPPHRKMTHGGGGFFWLGGVSVGPQSAKNLSTAGADLGANGPAPAGENPSRGLPRA